MKKLIITSLAFITSFQSTDACAWYDPDYEYFNLFTQSIVKDKSLSPFLLSYSSPYYEEKGLEVPDDNIAAWQRYFNKRLSFEETKTLVYDISLEELNHLKFKRSLDHPILEKLGYNFYTEYKDAVDYLIEAKYLEPYMRIQHIENPDSFYYTEKDYKQATDLDYDKINTDLISLYHATKSKEIKLRYGYQIVRFNHYYRNYEEAINAFDQYVAPLNLKTTPYYMALDQMAGAQRGLGMLEDANWNFFQVFRHSLSRKSSAYSSMKLTTEVSFQDILNRSKSKEEKEMAYFLLAYQDFNNPLPMMHKIYEINPSSDALMILEARIINELERNILNTYYTAADDEHHQTSSKNEAVAKEKKKEEKKTSFWDKIVGFFKSLFGSNDKPKEPTTVTKQEIDEESKALLNNPNRIPTIQNTNIYLNGEEENTVDYLNEVETFTKEVRENSTDVFWDISYAYLKFLQKDYAESQVILNEIFTNNPAYNKQIQQMKMLNEIVSKPKIDAAFEEHIMVKYPDFFLPEKENIEENEEEYWNNYDGPTTRDFLQDILANRYYIQGEYAKSYLMSNKLTFLSLNPDFELTKKVEAFYQKPKKTTFEKQVLDTKFDVEDPTSYFNLIYGDYYARNGDFQKAYESYKNVINGNGFIPKTYQEWDSNTMENITKAYPKDAYNYFNNIPDLIFGHNYWISYESDDDITMVEEPFIDEFKTKPYTNKYHSIKNRMNKAELMLTVLNLQKVAQGKDERAGKANQLMGNLLYNTSKIGYYRHIFVFDLNNGNGEKFHFNQYLYDHDQPYYKAYPTNYVIESKNIDLAGEYYKKALTLTNNRESKARILFQLANVEQAEYYQWEANQPRVMYEDDMDYNTYRAKEKEQEKKFARVKRERFNKYFAELKNNYRDTQMIYELKSNCSYLESYLSN
ncbi:MAG: hypothetical protein ACR2MS_05280 [Weeksellaceae bacterium]